MKCKGIGGDGWALLGGSIEKQIHSDQVTVHATCTFSNKTVKVHLSLLQKQNLLYFKFILFCHETNFAKSVCPGKDI